MERCVSLSDFSAALGDVSIPDGELLVEYHDETHHSTDEWKPLVRVLVSTTGLAVGSEDSERYYSVELALDDSQDTAALPLTKSLRGALSLALARVGLLHPEVHADLLNEVTELNLENGLVIIPDTNALFNGAVHWLLRTLTKPAVWLFPLVASLTQVQNRDAVLKNLLGNTSRPNNLGKAVRSRAMVNGTLGLIERNKGRSQVIELDPSLLRYQKTASKSGADPDQSDILEDRLIIEGIHTVLRSMRSRTSQRVVTSDVHMGRILSAEGIPTLFVPTIHMDDSPIPCLRYDPLTRTFTGAPLKAVLWEFAHTFGTIRVSKGEHSVLSLSCYWPQKGPLDWQRERLTVSTPEPPQAGPVQDKNQQDARSSAIPSAAKSRAGVSSNPTTSAAPSIKTSAKKPAGEPRAVRKTSSGSSDSDGRQTDRSVGQVSTALPRASLPQMLRILGVVYADGDRSVSEIVAKLEQNRPTEDTARRAIDILRRVDLVGYDGSVIRAKTDAGVLDNALRKDDLDTASSIFSRFPPYAIFLRELRRVGEIPRQAVRAILVDQIGPVGADEAERLPRFHVLLGQAWTNGDVFLDGSHRIPDREVVNAFETAFRQTAREGFAQVNELLPRFCLLTKMSPWAAKNRLESLISERSLAAYRTEPAAGKKPVGRDEVIAGRLSDVRTQQVAIDRLQLGEQPVFTIGGPS